MDDTRRIKPLSLSRIQNSKNYRHLQADDRSVGTPPWFARTMPQNCLKTKMLGGRAKTIRRLGGNFWL
jgi:hypothetical protein